MGDRNLREAFSRAGLPLKVVATSNQFSRYVTTDAFLFDIRDLKCGKNENRQTFIMHIGKGNKISVVATDAKRKQAIMKVSEPERQIIRKYPVFDNATNKWKQFRDVTVTPSEERWFLLGEDERHLFVAQLPSGATTVSEAHRLLRPQSLKNARVGKDFRRQGEWFFVEVDKKTNARLSEYFSRATSGSTEKERKLPDSFSYSANSPVGTSGGRPHIAAHVLSRSARDTFVMGSVSHPDHKTIHFSSWMRVSRNAEVINNPFKGVQWID